MSSEPKQSGTCVVDIHTHIYPTSYISMLKERSSIPYIRVFPPSKDLRLVILPAEDTESTSRGRPVGPEYYDIEEKIKFMDVHNIDISVISLANPWLDWVPPDEGGAVAQQINDEVDKICHQYAGRLYFFATLPLSASVHDVLAEISRLSQLKYVRGIILGTTGLGKGLDDNDLTPVFRALAAAKLPIFLHPHYGLPSSVWGPQSAKYGHVLPLALGFPMETTIAVTRMILADVFTLIPDLKVILAHSGGTLPFLAGRIESCIEHDSHLKLTGKLAQGRKSVWEILKENVFLDAVIYGQTGLRAAIEASGANRVMFGTDHPFFPPLGDETRWPSVETNVLAVREAFDGNLEAAAAVMGGNAVEILNLR